MDNAICLPAIAAGRKIAFPKAGVARPHDLADYSTLDDIADLGGRRVRALAADPTAHIGVE